MNSKLRFLLALLLVQTCRALSADQPTLQVGDPAPKLDVAEWIQGGPVKAFESDKAYIVEFWATWCGPCKISIPRLNAHYLKYRDKGLVVIGQDCWEKDDHLVAPFVKSMGEKMTYAVALDDKKTDAKGAMADTWMAAAGRNGIPSAFLIGLDGRIAWIGHPMELDDSTIESVLAGKFDGKKFAEDKQRMQQLRKDFDAACRQKEWDRAWADLGGMQQLTPEDKRPDLDRQRFTVLIGKKDYKAAYAAAERFSDSHLDNAQPQNELAWDILTDSSIAEDSRNLGLANKLATRAVDASKHKNASCLDTLASILFAQGKQQDAIATEETAVKFASFFDDPQSIQKRLACFKKGNDQPERLSQQAEDFQKSGHPAEAEAALRQELAVEQQLWPAEQSLWQETVTRLTDLLAKQGNIDGARKVFAGVLTSDFVRQTAAAPMLRQRAEFFARRGRWKQAADDFAQSVALEPENPEGYHPLAALLVKLGDTNGYQRLCSQMLERFGDTDNEIIAKRVSRDCLILPQSGADLTMVGKLADLAVSKSPGDAWAQYGKGLAEYRQGDFTAAAAELRKALGDHEASLDVGAASVLSLAQHHIGKADAAQFNLAKVDTLMEKNMPKFESGAVGDRYWNDWLVDGVLHQEARAVIGFPKDHGINAP